MSEENPEAPTCVTASMDGWKTCIAREHGEPLHRVQCDGWAWSKRLGGWVACTGCLPRLADHGHVCAACYAQIERALVEWTMDRAAVLAGLTRAVSHDNAGIRSASAGHVNLRAPWMAYDEVEGLLNQPDAPYRGRLEHWVASAKGAENAVRFARAATQALRAHELEEKAHTVQHVRCPDCEHLNLVWNPVSGVRQNVFITCQNPQCLRTLTQDDFEVEAVRQEGVEEPVVDPAGPVTLDPNEAEPFDPEFSEHARFDLYSTRPLTELRALGEQLDVARWRSLTKNDLIAAIRAAENPMEEAS